MSLLATKALGRVELSVAEVFCFSEGLYGFVEEKEFALMQEKEDSPFLWLQSTRQAGLAFVVIDPALFYKTPYTPEVSALELDSLGVTSVAQCQSYVIVTIPADHPEEMTANLQGPVLLNRGNKTGRQVISLNDTHNVRTPILKQLEG